MATILTCDPQAVASSLFTSTTDQQERLGERVVSPDGRVYRYSKAGGSALVPGTLLQAPAEATGVQDLTPVAAAIGDTTVTTSSITVTANEYAGGWLIITVTPGQGYQYKIKSHPAATAAACVLTLEDPLLVALTTSSRMDMVKNPYNGVVINPSTATSTPVGVAVYPIPSGSYGWIQVGGVATILSDGGSTVGTNVSASNATAGAVEAAVTAQAAIGVAVTGVASTEYGAFKLTLE